VHAERNDFQNGLGGENGERDPLYDDEKKGETTGRSPVAIKLDLAEPETN